MSGRPQNNAKGNARAGLPLARAQRLAAETDKRARKGRAGILYGIGVLGVVGLVGVGVISADTGLQAAANVPQIAVPEAPVAIATPAETEAVPAAVFQPDRKPAVLTSIPVDPTQPECVQFLETRLNVLYRMSAPDADTSGLEDAVGGLVQAALDCDDTQLRITGSMELIGTNLADIRVRWKRADWLLDLAMVEIADSEDTPPAADISEDSVEFVVR